MECAFAAERLFGPSVSPCRRPFDFTLMFEQVFLHLVPSCVFTVGAFARLLILARNPAKPVAGGIWHTLKLVRATNPLARPRKRS